MGSVPARLRSRWRSRNLGGQARHQCVVRVRRGFMDRAYQQLVMLDGSKPQMPTIWKGINNGPWQGQWTLEGPWITLPEIVSNKWTRSFASDSGGSTATVVMDNINFAEHTGVAGMYHTIERGYFSPQKGIRVNSRPKMWAANSWADVLNGGYQLEIWEGYGPDGDPSVIPLDEPGEDGTCVPPNAAISRTWVGLIDECDIDTHPDQMTITCRDFGIFLTDQRLIYRNKAPEIRSPVIFADRRRTLGETDVGFGAKASGTHPGFTPTGALPGDGDNNGWVSDVRDSASDLVWLEIKIPAGAYDEFFLGTEGSGQEMWVAVNPTDGSHWNGGGVPGGGAWIDGGLGNVPGTGVPFVNHFKTVSNQPGRKNLGGTLSCGNTTRIRLYFSNLNTHYFDSNGDRVKVHGYAATVFRFYAERYGTDPQHPENQPGVKGVKASQWVLVDDAADVVRMMFMWAGFKEWDVDDFGWSLASPMNWGQDKFFMDAINDIMNQGNFLFYMEAPGDDDMSLGKPCFKKQRAVTLNPPITATVRDTDMLESLKIKWDLSNLPYSFRVRGNINKKGITFGQDLARRFSGTYFPPWSGIDYRKISPTKRGIHMDHSERLAGLKRNYIETQGQVIALSLNSDADCLFAAVLTAIQYALQEATGELQISGLPGIELNTGVTVVDEGTGTNSRVWVASVESDHNLGESGSWHMTIGGSLLDTEDLNFISEDWAYVVYKYSMVQAN